jgi:hypothetical protein
MVIGCSAGLRFRIRADYDGVTFFPDLGSAALGFRALGEHDKARGIPPGPRLVPLVPALKRHSPRCHFLRFGAVADAFTAITH